MMARLPQEEHHVRLRVICANGPSVSQEDEIQEFGLQDRHESLHPGEAQPDGSLRFECQLRVRRDPATGKPNFLGDWAHGTAASRHLYLSLRRIGETGEWQWMTRIKVPLQPVSWQQIEEIVAREDGVLQVRVEGKGSGTVPLLGKGWEAITR